MYKVDNGLQSFDDHLDELGFSFGGILKAASPLLKVGSAIGIPGAGAASAAVDIAGKLGKKKKARPPTPPTTARPASTASRQASTARTAPTPTTTQDPALLAQVSRINSILDRNQIRERALKIIRSKGADARYKKELIQKLNIILKQLKQLDAYVHSELGRQTTVSPGVVDILGGKDFVNNLGR